MPAAAEMPPALDRVPARTRVEDWVWTREFAVPLVERQLHVRSLEGYRPDRPRAGRNCRRRGASLRPHHAEERSPAHRFAAFPGALQRPRTRPGDGAQSRTGRAAVCRPGRPSHALPFAGRMLYAHGQTPVARHHPAAADGSGCHRGALRGRRRSARRSDEARRNAPRLLRNSRPRAPAGAHFAGLGRPPRRARPGRHRRPACRG